MTRVLWIVGLSIALFAFAAFSFVCVAALVLHKHLNRTGWTMLVLSAYGAWVMFGRLRCAVVYGDPTKDMSRESSD
jgi:uncharacterized membrane protein